MKKSIRIIAVALVAVMLCLSLVACGKKLSGTYSAEILGSGAEYEFKGSKVTVTAEVLGFEKNFEGKYEITDNDEGETVIIFTFEDKDAEKYSGEFAFAEGKEGDTKYIKIGGVKYNKVD